MASPVHDRAARNIAVLLALPWMKAASAENAKRARKKPSPNTAATSAPGPGSEAPAPSPSSKPRRTARARHSRSMARLARAATTKTAMSSAGAIAMPFTLSGRSGMPMSSTLTLEPHSVSPNSLQEEGEADGGHE